MTQTNILPSAHKSLTKREIEFAETAATLCGVLSVAGLASAATLEWIKALQIEPVNVSMYKISDFHAAAPVSTFPVAPIVVVLVIVAGVFYYAHKSFLKHRHHS